MKKVIMKNSLFILIACLLIFLTCILFSCKEKNAGPAKEIITAMNLKSGDLITCGPNELGSVAFEMDCSEKVKENFNLGVKLLHSFEYDEAEKVFSKVIDVNPKCAMAYWGVAMSNFHPLWTPPSEAELKKGSKAIEIAETITGKSKREQNYIDAIAAFYNDWEKLDHRTRCINFEKSMEKLYSDNPRDPEAAIFYALALNASADPSDKTFTKQKKAGSILNSLYPDAPNHPGIVHYIIHTYDSPELAELALPAARKYATVAPSSAHALHMPSHIFTRLGLWDECINSNLASVSSSKCYAEAAGIKGHWDEELHGLDYLVYGYLQKGENDLAKKQWDYLNTINEVHPVNFKVAYAFAAIPARYLLENRNWKAASNLPIKENFPWQKFPWQKAITHFARVIGSVHVGKIDLAKAELKELNKLHDTLMQRKEMYSANQVQIQIKSAEAWIKFKEGNDQEALALMNHAAEMEDKTEKHPVTPGEILPAKELLADMLLQMNKPAEALKTYEEDLKKHPNRFNGLYGAGLAAEKSNNVEKANFYYKKLLTTTTPEKSDRLELQLVNTFIKTH
jgi:tetratricopeptide (TPR) repeat protein